MILNRRLSPTSAKIPIRQEEKGRKNEFVSAKAIPLNALMGFFDEKRLRGTVHNGLIRGGRSPFTCLAV